MLRTKLWCKAAEIAATRTLKAQFFFVCHATYREAFHKKIPPTEITTFHTCVHHSGTLWMQTCILAGKRGKHCCESFNRFPITKLLSLLKVQFRDTKSFLPASMQACSLRSSHTASPAMIARHVQRAQRFHMKSRLLFKFSTAFAWGSNSPPPGILW